jgi:hypothetical protein
MHPHPSFLGQVFVGLVLGVPPVVLVSWFYATLKHLDRTVEDLAVRVRRLEEGGSRAAA